MTHSVRGAAPLCARAEPDPPLPFDPPSPARRALLIRAGAALAAGAGAGVLAAAAVRPPMLAAPADMPPDEVVRWVLRFRRMTPEQRQALDALLDSLNSDRGGRP